MLRLLLVVALVWVSVVAQTDRFAASSPGEAPREGKKKGFLKSAFEFLAGRAETFDPERNKRREKAFFDTIKRAGRAILSKKKVQVDNGKEKGVIRAAVDHFRNWAHNESKEVKGESAQILVDAFLKRTGKFLEKRAQSDKPLPRWLKQGLRRLAGSFFKLLGRIIKAEGKIGKSRTGAWFRDKLQYVAASIRARSCQWIDKNNFSSILMKSRDFQKQLLHVLKKNWGSISADPIFKIESDETMMQDLITNIEYAYEIIGRQYGGDLCRYMRMMAKDRLEAFNMFGNYSLSDASAQKNRFEYRRTLRAAEDLLQKHDAEWLRPYLPTVLNTMNQTNARPPMPVGAWLSMALLFGMAFVGSCMVVFLGLLWKGTLFHVSLVSLVGVGSAGRVAYWVLWGFYVGESSNPKAPAVASFMTQTIVEGISYLVFVAALMIFVFVLVKANFDTFYPEKSKMMTVFGILTLVIGVLFGGYMIGVSVAVEVIFTEFILNLANVIGATLRFFYSFLLVLGLAMAMYHVRKDQETYSHMNRSVLVFLVAGCLLMLVFALQMAVAFCYTFVNMSQFKMYFHLNGVCELMLAACVLTYSFLAMRSSRVPSNLHKVSEKEYVPLVEEEVLPESSIPERYQDF